VALEVSRDDLRRFVPYQHVIWARDTADEGEYPEYGAAYHPQLLFSLCKCHGQDAYIMARIFMASRTGETGRCQKIFTCAEINLVLQNLLDGPNILFLPTQLYMTFEKWSAYNFYSCML